MLGESEMNSVTSEIENFQKGRLKKTETKVRTCHGRVFVEKLDSVTGNYSASDVGQLSYGWVGDTKRDLQLAEIRKNVLLGSQDVASDFDLLHKNRITHILNLAPAVENSFSDDFVYLKLPILDVPETDITLHFDKTNDFISSALSSKGRIYVHCNAGVSRAPTIVAAYLMKTEKISAKDALESIKYIRPSISPNKGFLQHLDNYEKIFLCSAQS